MSRAPLNWSPRAFLHRGAQIAVDAGLVALAFWLAFYFRFDGNVPGRYEKLFAATVGIVIVVKLATFVAMRFYTKWWRFTSVRDLQAIVLAVVASSLLITAILSQWRPDDRVPIPRGVLLFDLVLTLVLIGGARFAVRSVIERPSRFDLVNSGRSVLIVGAGDAGNTLLREMKRNRDLGYTPVGLIDDDPRKRRLRVQGTRVRARGPTWPGCCATPASTRSSSPCPRRRASCARRSSRCAARPAIPCSTLPSLPELITGEVTVRQLRKVRVEDVLGRAPVEVDFERVARYLNGRSVLVTGAGGSIGRELCRQVAASGARRLVMVDHAENNLFEVDLQLRERGHAGLLVPVIADCKDATAMERVFATERPDIVFHAAAYKHVPMMELNPLQAVANNGLGTDVLARLAEQYGVDRFCLISTDKAVEPKTVMGASKALAERVIEAHGAASGTRFGAVRFGNVLGSSGSVLPIFQRQIEQGGPVTVTHAEMTRFFMTIPEAVQLVIQATGIAEGGDIFVLNMGEPVKIIDLARRMIELSGHEPGRDIAIDVVGIRPGEKLHEELFNVDEEVRPTRYGKIMRATRPALDAEVLRGGLDEIGRRVAAGAPEPVAEALWTVLRGGRVQVTDGEAGVSPPPSIPHGENS